MINNNLYFTSLYSPIQEADRHVVNCVQPHPYEPIIASSGIDYNVKLWAPISNDLTFDEEAAKTVHSIQGQIIIFLNNLDLEGF